MKTVKIHLRAGQHQPALFLYRPTETVVDLAAVFGGLGFTLQWNAQDRCLVAVPQTADEKVRSLRS